MSTTIKKNVPIQFGLVMFTATIVTAVERAAKDTHMYCTAGHDPARVTSAYSCTSEDCEASSGWVKGVERDGKLVILTEEDIKELAQPDLGQRIELKVYQRDHVMAHTLPGDTAYYLTPGTASDGPYGLVSELVRSNPDKALVAMFRPRSNHQVRLWLLTTSGDALVMQSLYWPQDVFTTPAVPAFPVDSKLLAMAQRALKALTEKKFNPAEFLDPVRASRDELLAARDGETLDIPGGDKMPPPIDLFAALQATTEAAAKPRRRRTAAA